MDTNSPVLLPDEKNNNDEPENQHEPDIPQLYSPQVIGIFAILFSILFGGILLAINFKTLKNKKGIQNVLAFSFLYTVTQVVIMNQFMSAAPILSIVLNVTGALLLTNYYWRNFIGTDILFRKKSYAIPLIIGIGLSVLLYALLIVSQQGTI